VGRAVRRMHFGAATDSGAARTKIRLLFEANSIFLLRFPKYMTSPLRVGIVGSGYISAAYLKAAKHFSEFAPVACADAIRENAVRRGEEFGLKAETVDELLHDNSVDIILNLTTPQSHFEITSKALQAGKHVYSEKPLTLSLREAEILLKLGREHNVRLGCAPDTFLGGGQQTVRKLVDDGAIGKPVGGTAFIMTGGPETWHPNPQFYYQKGGGPVFDMGPYYLTALINLFGPIKRVTSIGRRSLESRVFGAGPNKGGTFPIEILTHFNALLDFDQGPVISFHASFDVPGHTHLPIEIYGTEGSLQVPDPNTFGGPVRLLEKGGKWNDVPLTHGFADGNYRSLGVAEMAAAIRANRQHRAAEDLVTHTVEVMEAIVNGGETGQPISIITRCERPRALQPITTLGLLE
jgi:predicted dehydrogenase